MCLYVRIQSYHDKLLYSDDIRRSYQSLKNLCLPCELAIAQAPPHSSRTIGNTNYTMLINQWMLKSPSNGVYVL